MKRSIHLLRHRAGDPGDGEELALACFPGIADSPFDGEGGLVLVFKLSPARWLREQKPGGV